MSPVFRVSVVFLATFGAGAVGFLFVDSHAGSWYASLVKPPLTPPNWVFPVVWPILYALMAAAASIVWTKKPQTPETEGWLRFYFIQILFNAAWTMFFFGFHATLIAFIDILFLGFIVVVLIADVCAKDRWCPYLLAPYMAWILFAAYLNLGIWLLN